MGVISEWGQWVWSMGVVCVVNGSSGCGQCSGPVDVVTVSGQWVVDMLFTSHE